MRIVCWHIIPSRGFSITPFFFGKLGKMSQNLSTAAVVIGTLRVNDGYSSISAVTLILYDFLVAVKAAPHKCLIRTGLRHR